MTNPIQAAGAQTDPTRYGALNMGGEQFTGLWTQRSPYRDAATAYLIKKFYQGSRFDSIWDGLNREISARLTDVRRPGNPVWNASTFGKIGCFYSFKYVQDGATVIRVMADDSTSVSAPSTFTVASVTAGMFPYGEHGSSIYLVFVTFTAAIPPTDGTFTFSGLTGFTTLNGKTLTPWNGWSSNVVTFQLSGTGAAYGPTADTGSCIVTNTSMSGGTVYDVTAGGKTPIWTKSAGAGRTRFLSVGSTLYMANGVDNVKWIRSGLVWKAAKVFSQGQFLVDSNNNLQLNIGSQTATITGVQIQGNICTVFFSSNPPSGNTAGLDCPLGTKVTFAGCTTVTALNGLTLPVEAVANELTISFALTHGNLAYSAETGTATTGNGTTGATQPTWATGLGAVTVDAGAQWENRGSSVQQWGYDAPPNAPSVTQAAAPTLYPAWAANTWYGNPLAIIDSNGNGQQLSIGGVTGATHPTWATSAGATTTDNTATWTCLGPASWSAGMTATLGQVVQVTFTYYITVGESIPYPPYYQLVSTPYTVTMAFQCTVPGTTGLAIPQWTNGGYTVVVESTGVTWVNIGLAPAWPANATTSTAVKIVDANGNVQQAQLVAESGSAAPGWNVTTGGFTGDRGQNWLNLGPYSPANTGAWIYAYSGLNSITGDITTASPVSQPILVQSGKLAVIQGLGLDNSFDQIIIWRTVQQTPATLTTPSPAATLLYDDAIPNPGPGQTWIYTDTTPDTGLNAFEAAPVALSNSAPPAGMTAPAYHMQRIWAIDGEYVRYSGGPDTLVGNGNDTFPPINFFLPPASAVKLRPITVENGGLLVYTTSGIQIILGQGTASDPFYMTSYCDKVNLASYDAEDILGTQLYIMESNLKVSTLQIQYPFNPQSGYSEVGFPIGDQFKKVTTGGIFTSLYTGAGSYLSWNIAQSGDTGMYVADGAVGWFRMSSVATPESGLLWSPRAGIAGGTSAVQSVETSPGVFQLLIGPAASGPILARDTTGTVFLDAGAAYPGWDCKGVNLLCPTGQTTEVVHISAKSAAVGARPAVSILLGEIYPTAARPWNPLVQVDQDPPKPVPESVSVYSDRYKTKINGRSLISDCILTKFDYGAQNAADELMDWGIYATTEDERKEQAAK